MNIVRAVAYLPASSLSSLLWSVCTKASAGPTWASLDLSDLSRERPCDFDRSDRCAARQAAERLLPLLPSRCHVDMDLGWRLAALCVADELKLAAAGGFARAAAGEPELTAAGSLTPIGAGDLALPVTDKSRLARLAESELTTAGGLGSAAKAGPMPAAVVNLGGRPRLFPTGGIQGTDDRADCCERSDSKSRSLEMEYDRSSEPVDTYDPTAGEGLTCKNARVQLITSTQCFDQQSAQPYNFMMRRWRCDKGPHHLRPTLGITFCISTRRGLVVSALEAATPQAGSILFVVVLHPLSHSRLSRHCCCPMPLKLRGNRPSGRAKTAESTTLRWKKRTMPGCKTLRLQRRQHRKRYHQ